MRMFFSQEEAFSRASSQYQHGLHPLPLFPEILSNHIYEVSVKPILRFLSNLPQGPVRRRFLRLCEFYLCNLHDCILCCKNNTVRSQAAQGSENLRPDIYFLTGPLSFRAERRAPGWIPARLSRSEPISCLLPARCRAKYQECADRPQAAKSWPAFLPGFNLGKLFSGSTAMPLFPPPGEP